MSELNLRQDIEWQYTALDENHRTVWGGGIRRDKAEQQWTLPGPRTLNQWRLFGHDEWHLSDRALLNLGAMLEDDGAGHQEVSPRISFNYHLLPQHTVRVSYSAATRNPVMAEMFIPCLSGCFPDLLKVVC